VLRWTAKLLRLVLSRLSGAYRADPGRGSDFEVNFEGFDQWNKPGEKLEMDRVGCVGIQRITVRKLHDAAELITLGSRREVGSDVGFEDAWNLGVELVDLVVGALFLSFGGSGFPTETKSVDDHGGIVIGLCGS
jgi:hypothetical protein